MASSLITMVYQKIKVPYVIVWSNLILECEKTFFREIINKISRQDDMLLLVVDTRKQFVRRSGYK